EPPAGPVDERTEPLDAHRFELDGARTGDERTDDVAVDHDREDHRASASGESLDEGGFVRVMRGLYELVDRWCAHDTCLAARSGDGVVPVVGADRETPLGDAQEPVDPSRLRGPAHPIAAQQTGRGIDTDDERSRASRARAPCEGIRED